MNPAEAAPKPIPGVARDASYLARSAVGSFATGSVYQQARRCPLRCCRKRK